MLEGKTMNIKVTDEIATKTWEMHMNGGRSKIREYLASQNILVPIGWRITDIGCDLSGKVEEGYFLVVTKFI